MVLAAFFGNRGGHQPLVGPGYVLLPEEILVAYGRLEKTTAGFTWPAWVAQEHYDLLDHQENAQQIIAALDGAGTTLLVVPRDELLAEMGRLALPPAAEALYRSQVIKRLRRVQEGEPELWNRVASRYSAPQLQAVEALLLPKKK